MGAGRHLLNPASGVARGAFLRAGGGSWVLKASGHWSSQLQVGKKMHRAKRMPSTGNGYKDIQA